MLSAVPAELVWFVGPSSAAYDVLLYRAATAELWLAAALAGHDPAGLWHCERLAERHDVWERAFGALLGSDAVAGEGA